MLRPLQRSTQSTQALILGLGLPEAIGMSQRGPALRTNYALLDVDEVAYNLDGQRTVKGGPTRLDYSGVLAEAGSGQELRVKFTDPPSSFMLYFTTDGTDWWIYRAWVSVDGER